MIRDYLIPLVRKRGALEIQRDSVRQITLRTGDWVIEHWTPFNALSSEEAASPGYRHPLERQHTASSLPYGLNVWHAGVKELSLLWADSGTFKVIEFLRGSWEAEALAP